jgi:hypothetical protein
MRAVRVLGTATVLAVLAGGVSLPAAQAVPPVPVPPVSLPAAIDLPAFYEAQTVCDPTPRPGATALGNLLVTTYGPATVYIPRACSGSVSEHFDGRAVDWMRTVRDPAQKEMADAFVDWLLAPAADGTPHEMARRLGIMYIIWNNRMIRMYDPGRGWTDYRSCLDPSRQDRSLDTSCHRDHVHLSLSWDGAAMATSWWTGVAQALPSCRAATTGAVPAAGTPQVVADLATVPGLVPVAPTTVLDTAAGVGGNLAAGCRLLAGRALHPRAVVPGAPVDARWAAVAVRSTSNAPAHLVGWSSGAARPRTLLGTPIGTTAGTLLVPIASDGTIGLGTTLGSAAVAAQVVGYLPGEPVTTVPAAPTTPSAVATVRPTKPRSVRASSSRRAVVTRWKAPKRAGDAPITGYRVQALSSKARGAAVAGTCTTGPAKRSCTIRGLKKGTKYWMSVSVTNAAGTTWAARRAVRVR